MEYPLWLLGTRSSTDTYENTLQLLHIRTAHPCLRFAIDPAYDHQAVAELLDSLLATTYFTFNIQENLRWNS